MDFEKINPFENGYLKTTLSKKLTNGLKKICLSKNKSIDDWSTYNFYEWDFPEIKELNTIQVEMVKEFMRTYGSVTQSGVFDFSGWVNIRQDKSWHSPHYHVNIPLTFNTYVSVPKGTTVSFMNPDQNYGDRKGKVGSSSHIIKPKEGTMILTPGWWLHWTDPTFSNKYRISMSTNVTIHNNNFIDTFINNNFK